MQLNAKWPLQFPYPSEHNYNTLLLHSVVLCSWNTAVWESKQYRQDEANLPAVKVYVH